MYKKFSILTVLALGMAAQLAAADTVTLSAAKDNTLYEDAAGALSNGAGEFMFSGMTGAGTIRRALLAFDIAGSIPAGSTITGATLTLHMSRTSAGDKTVDLHRLLMDWGEGASDAPGTEGAGAAAQLGDATWLHTFYDTGFWPGTGGDFSPVLSDSQLVGGDGFYTWSSAQMADDVQMWLDDPAKSFGWAVIGDEGTVQTAKRFDTHENIEPAFRPVLEVVFVPEPGMLVLMAGGGLALLRRRRAS